MQNRPLRPFEQGAHLHVLDWTHQTARYRLQAAGAAQVKAGARSVVSAPTDAQGPLLLPSLEAAVVSELRQLYAVGYATVRSELDHQVSGDRLPVGLSLDSWIPRFLDSWIPDRRILAAGNDPGHFRARARLIVQSVSHAIWQAAHRGRLAGIQERRRLRELAIAAGHGALGQAATHHSGGVINAGREAAARERQAQIVGGRYTSVLDKATCGPCALADTGELLALDSPEWIPTPNPACEGGDRCRCIHVYQLASEPMPEPALVAAGH